jgi:F-type H+-transporting ATPase subunit alpha
MAVGPMAVSLYAVSEGYLDDLPLPKIIPFEAALHAHMANSYGDLMERINATGAWDKDIEATFKKALEEFKTTGSW